MEIKSPGWCATCCTQHELSCLCPGELTVTGAERHGWRVNAQTSRGIEAYGVLLAPCHDLWRARILTYPNVLWLVPGGRQTMKFVGPSAGEAERKAAQFIRDYCRQRGFRLRSEVDLAGPAYESSRAARSRRSQKEPAPRKVRFLPVRFGVVAPSESGGTGNLSETGMFIITEVPMEMGTQLVINLNAGDQGVAMRGRVRWMRKEHHAGRTPGMGVQLAAPPPSYIEYVRELE